MQFPTDFCDPTYLQTGNERQRNAFALLSELDLFSALAPYSPVLAGTIPLRIDLPTSDLDVICEVTDFAGFKERLGFFSHQPGFAINVTEKQGMTTCICRFRADEEDIEIFGQPIAVTKSHAYRHMVVEGWLLELGGDQATTAIHDLKRRGLKTEPAFAQYFRLSGDPYQALLHLYDHGRNRLHDLLVSVSDEPT
jgi:hypothetical protein